MTHPAEPLLTAPEMAAILGLSSEAVHAMRGRGEIPSVKIGKRWMFQESQVQKTIMANTKHALEGWRQ